MTLALAAVSRTASSTLSNTGMSSNEVPPLPGVTPATMRVPYSLHVRVWNWPVAPVMPWVRTRVSEFTRMLMPAPLPPARPGRSFAPRPRWYRRR